MSIKDRVSGRLKKAAGDLTGDKSLQREGAKEERKADAKEDLKRAHEDVEDKAVRVRESEIEEERRKGRA